MTTRVAIVGGGAVTPLGDDLDATWTAVARGSTAVGPWPGAAAWGERVPWVARRPGGEGGWGEARDAQLLGPHGRWLLRAAQAAHTEARGGAWARGDVGLYTAFGPVDPAPEHLQAAVGASRGPDGGLDLGRFFRDGRHAVHPLWMLSMLPNVAAGVVAERLQLRGDFAVLGSEADAGARAVLEACRALRTGAVRAAIVGAAAEALSEASLARHDLAGVLARGPAHGQEGIAPGEGAAALALEATDSALARRAPILGWLRAEAGVGTLDGDGALERTIEPVLRRAGWGWEDVDLLIGGFPTTPAAGGTPLGGRGEGGLGRLGRANPAARVLSVQPRLGHLGAAAALLDVLLALHGFSVGGVPGGSDLARERVGRPSAEPLPPRRALVLARSSAGGLAVLLVESTACAS